MEPLPNGTDVWPGNLASLERIDPGLASRLAKTLPAQLAWSSSRAGPLTATIEHQGRELGLASRFDPHDEAHKLLAEVNYQKHAALVFLGMGLGYHIAEAAKQMGPEGLILIFEPDLSVLRAVLEKIDHRSWLRQSNVIFADPEMDRGALIGRLERWAGIITQGVLLVTHPPTRTLKGPVLQSWGQSLTEAMAYCRTNVATALVNATRTMRNQTLNLPYYMAGADTNELHNHAQGFAAVCVGAGPSLARNIDLLRDPAHRRNVVLISAQTTLKPLLDRDIRPDFVTALDYHEISKRFYEGLPDLPEVTLVAEPKANPTILDSFPGPIRLTADGFLDRLLGPGAKPIVPIPGGATVAHLSFYLAQHLGCDPIILIGQDLGFSDGLYYCPGTSIHDVWASELNAFNTLEMMEWQRIVRHRGHLQKLEDIHGRPCYSDEQMLTYLKQFERDFSAAKQVVIDASEGGLPKPHTRAMPLAQALDLHARRRVPALPRPKRGLDKRGLQNAAALLRQRLSETRALEQTTRKTVPILRKMLDDSVDSARMDRLFVQLEHQRQRVAGELAPIFNLINSLNALGSFRRARADRALQHGQESPQARQRQQLQRDLDNLDWLGQACTEALTIFDEALDRTRLMMDPP